MRLEFEAVLRGICPQDVEISGTQAQPGVAVGRQRHPSGQAVDPEWGCLRDFKVVYAPIPPPQPLCMPFLLPGEERTPPRLRPGGKDQSPVPPTTSQPPWGRTSGQPGGPERKAAKNRPWECLNVCDSAGPGGRAGRGGFGAGKPALSPGSEGVLEHKLVPQGTWVQEHGTGPAGLQP